ncbi:GCN5 family acetyltransferase [Oceanicola sp. 22II-s10i]|nr:GCN5 family acetyltransferase [Oceanicola sp. 22II-s10i]
MTFRRMTADDLPLLGEWMVQPHWREWWGDPEVELGYVREMIEGADTTEPYFILLDGVPAGYIQMWRIADNLVEPWLTEAPWMLQLPKGAVGVDLSLSAEAGVSRGIGSAALRNFVAMLRERGHDVIIIDPDPANHRAVRAYTKAGFVPVAELEGRTGDSLIMRHMKDLTA